MNITKDMVGKKVKIPGAFLWKKILYVGDDYFFSIDQDGYESSCCIHNTWELYEEHSAYIRNKITGAKHQGVKGSAFAVEYPEHWETISKEEFENRSDKKKTVRVAPALLKYPNDRSFYISNSLYKSKEEAQEDLLGSGLFIAEVVRWPVNETSWVEVEE